MRARAAVPPPRGGDDSAIGGRVADARTVGGSPAEAGGRPGGSRYGQVRRLRLGWSVALAAVALLVRSGLGFGLGRSATPSGSAGTTFRGLGFLPAPGWTVVQGAVADSGGVSSAVAANVPLHPADGTGRLPVHTIESLPKHAVLIHVTFTPRGDPAADVALAPRALPMRVADAEPVTRPRAPSEHRLRAAVGGFNVEVRILFGRSRPTAGMLAAARRQLNRLVVSAEQVTIRAHPTVIGSSEPVTLFGSVESRRAGEVVEIQARDCGQRFFRGRASATTIGDGTWSTIMYPHISTTLRAVWKGSASAPVTVWQRAWVILLESRRRRGWLRVNAGGGDSQVFWRKKVLIQQRRGGSWRTIKQVVLTMDGTLNSTYFRVSVPRGTLLRAVLPDSQAKPCFRAGVSRTLRT